MDRIRGGLLGSADDGVDVQVGLGGCGTGQTHRMVGLGDEWLRGIRIRVDGNRLYRHVPTGPEHAASDLTAICHQDSPDHEPDEATGGNLFPTRDVKQATS